MCVFSLTYSSSKNERCQPKTVVHPLNIKFKKKPPVLKAREGINLATKTQQFQAPPFIFTFDGKPLTEEARKIDSAHKEELQRRIAVKQARNLFNVCAMFTDK